MNRADAELQAHLARADAQLQARLAPFACVAGTPTPCDRDAEIAETIAIARMLERAGNSDASDDAWRTVFRLRGDARFLRLEAEPDDD